MAITRNPLFLMVRPVGFEPTTSRFVVWRSIQLSHGRKVFFCNKLAERAGFEPAVHLLRRTIA